MTLSIQLHAAASLALFAGAFFNASRIPERYFPGQFDVFFNSHNIWHVLALLTGVLDFAGSYVSKYEIANESYFCHHERAI
jgi:predicted membrane channel-forming protein YqfA (hemolysin III family)